MQGEKTIDEHILRITGSVNLPSELELGKRYNSQIEIDVYDVSEIDNQDGTINRKYKVKMTGVCLIDDGNNIIKAKSKSSISQKLHAAIWYYHNQEGIVEDFDEYYEKIGKKIVAYVPEIIQFLSSKN